VASGCSRQHGICAILVHYFTRCIDNVRIDRQLFLGKASPQAKLFDAPLHLRQSLLEALRLEEACIRLHHPLRVSLMEESGVVHLAVIDGLYLSFIEPFDALTIFPQTILHLVVFGDDVGADAVLLSLEPEAFVATLIGPGVDTKAMLFVILVLALILTSVVPNVDAHSFHVVVEPFALVLATIEPRVDTDATDLVLSPVASVHRAVVPLIAADTVFATEGIVALVPRLVRPGLHSVAMLQVIFPHTFVLCAIHVLVDAAAVRFIIGPIPIVDITVDVDEATLAMGSVFSPFTGVFRTVAPGLFAEAITETSLPLACVDSARLESVSRPLFAGLVRNIDPLRNSLFCLLLGKIFAAAELLSLEHMNEFSCSMAPPRSL